MGSSCSFKGTRRVILVINPMKATIICKDTLCMTMSFVFIHVLLNTIGILCLFQRDYIIVRRENRRHFLTPNTVISTTSVKKDQWSLLKCVDTRNFTQRNQIPVKISKKSDVVQERSTKLNVSSCMYHTNKYCKADQLFVLIMEKNIFTLKNARKL